MPPKKKAAGTAKASAAVGAVSVSKRSKAASNGPSQTASSNGTSSATTIKKAGSNSVGRIRWEYQSKPDKWTVFSDENIEKLNEACEQSKKDVTLASPDDNVIVVKLAEMAQHRKDDKSKANIRCCFKDSDDKWHSWMYVDGDSEDKWLSLASSEILNAEYENPTSGVEIKLARSKYVVDVANMKLRSRKGVELDLERRESDADACDSVKQAKKPAAASKKESGTKRKKATSSAKAAAVQDDDNDSVPEVTVKRVKLKGQVPVDSCCEELVDVAHVYTEDGEVWDAMLNQTNLQFNNNKFYIMQLLENDTKNDFYVWFRWGRVGLAGQSSLARCGSNLQKAKTTFEKKFLAKTKNEWYERDFFEKYSGKYDLVHVDYDCKKKGVAKDAVDAPERNIPECNLDKRIQELIKLICNVKAMEQTVLEMKYDAKKAPLGKLTTGQIKAGYLALKKIDELVTEGSSNAALVQACNDFYTRIPHYFGMKTPPLISTKENIKEKIRLLEALGDIQIAMKMFDESYKKDENPIDSHYRGLNCNFKPLEKGSELFKLIDDYLQNSHEKLYHNMYKLQLLEVFECSKDAERKQFVALDNRMLLWHGSRLTNWAGILKEGLRIAPPEAPVTGYMFGKGIYFADRASKSANYCFTSAANNIGLLLLCEVSLGNCNEMSQACYTASNLPKDKHSVKGCGQIVPNEKFNVELDDGTVVPCGKSERLANSAHFSLNFNEYVIYDPKQIKMRFLLKVKFVYGK